MKFHHLAILFVSLLLAACQQQKPAASAPSAAPDPHSFSRPDLARAQHLDLNLLIDFDTKTLSGYARWTIENPAGASEIIFDTDNLDIQKITMGKDEKPAKFSLGARDSIFGSALRIQLEPCADVLTIYYATRPDAAALGWMEPSMTAGKKLPFLFTQGQAILTRSWIPCQDTPGNRITYNAEIQTPVGMMAVMSAENPQQKSPDGKYQFRMEQPVATYLIALAAGDIAFKSVGPRTGVYAEPPMLEKSAWEFAEMEKMVEAAEALYGSYVWGRYDLIVLPTGFPFGGMENPRLTFATPTVVTGDRSLVSLVAHELAHSWSGNLVTNSNWNDFWLNEGFTVYFERRIMEAVYGKDYTEMLAQLEYWELEEEVMLLGEDSPDTHLKLDLTGRNPDDGVGDIAYQKGGFFLTMLERQTDRAKWDAFLKSWFDEHKFTSQSTESFLSYLKTNYLEKYNLKVNTDEWVYAPGIPANCPRPNSVKLAAAEKAAADIARQLPDTKNWTPHEWVHFVRNLPAATDVATLKKLDAQFGLSSSANAEIRCAWYASAIPKGYAAEIMPGMESFLTEVGRRRFLMPVYTELKKAGLSDDARRIFQKAAPGYHAVSRNSVEALLK
ncbi:MAG TPA: M1 family metallopeptidase [Saprospiraceae bacterium]|nr:M1 family metallopeptidase [Saprospiraceae bacterium]